METCRLRQRRVLPKAHPLRLVKPGESAAASIGNSWPAASPLPCFLSAVFLARLWYGLNAGISGSKQYGFVYTAAPDPTDTIM